MASIKQLSTADIQSNVQSGRLAKAVEQFDVDAMDELTKEQAKQVTLYSATET